MTSSKVPLELMNIEMDDFCEIPMKTNPVLKNPCDLL